MSAIPVIVQAGLWGFIAGGALLIGALIGYYLSLPRRVTSSIMAFGIGVLIAALSFDLMTEAFITGGVWAAISGFIFGAASFAIANATLARAGAQNRKMSMAKPAGASASLAIAVGSLLDGVPESAAIGISLLDGEGVAWVTVAAIFISNVPEGLSSSVGMKRDGKSAIYVFSIWISIALACAVAACLGYALIGQAGPFWIAAATATAAGAIFVMLIDTMIPEAFEDIHAWSGPVAAAGFLFAFGISHMA